MLRGIEKRNALGQQRDSTTKNRLYTSVHHSVRYTRKAQRADVRSLAPASWNSFSLARMLHAFDVRVSYLDGLDDRGSEADIRSAPSAVSVLSEDGTREDGDPRSALSPIAHRSRSDVARRRPEDESYHMIRAVSYEGLRSEVDREVAIFGDGLAEELSAAEEEWLARSEREARLQSHLEEEAWLERELEWPEEEEEEGEDTASIIRSKAELFDVSVPFADDAMLRKLWASVRQQSTPLAEYAVELSPSSGT